MRKLYLLALLPLMACSNMETPEDRFLAASKSYELALIGAQAYRDHCEEQLGVKPRHGCREVTEEIQLAQKHLIEVYVQAYQTFAAGDAPFYELAIANVTAALAQLNLYLKETDHAE